jgi:hypothetical protein
MAISASMISAAIAIISATIALWTITNIFLKVRNSKNITITKSSGERITISKNYNREQSKRLLEFMK